MVQMPKKQTRNNLLITFLTSLTLKTVKLVILIWQTTSVNSTITLKQTKVLFVELTLRPVFHLDVDLLRELELL
jgi:hypothetical protein